MTTLEILSATVGHERFTPKQNRFAYKVFYVICPVTNDTIRTPHGVSFNRFNIFSLYTRDHGARTSESWRSWIERECARLQFPIAPDDTVLLIAHPRLCGYVFNPISYWLIFEKSTHLKGVLCEVHNTFGDDHNYLLTRPDHGPIMPNDVFYAEKQLYVSPFNDVEQGSYRFSFTWTAETFSSVINFYNRDVYMLNTYVGGTHRTLTSSDVFFATFRYPLMTLHIVVRIHYQALRLYLKGVAHTLARRPAHTSGNTSTGTLVEH